MIDFLIANGADINTRDVDEKGPVEDIVEILAIVKGFKKRRTLFTIFNKT